MSVRSQLREPLSRFDDDALVAWANRGLLRRACKDLELHQPALVEDSAIALKLEFLGHTISFDSRGPSQASCSCPATGVCHHLLAAVLWLQRESAESTESARGGVDATSAEAEEGGVKRLHEELVSISVASLEKHAGKTGYRWAWQYVQDIEPGREPSISAGRNIVINLRQPRIAFRYMGGDIEQLIADTQVKAIEKYRVAAMLAYQRTHGVNIAPPQNRQGPKPIALDLGMDHALPNTTQESQRDSRARIRESVAQLLGECVDLGLSHLSHSVQERFTTLAVWAQGAEYFRLALLLRRIADHVELLLERAGGADEHRLMEELSLAFGLVSALSASDHRSEAPTHLLGRARSRYDTAGALTLLGLGALPWRAASGYVGLTLMFWSPEEKRFLSWTDARPEIQRFDPIARYSASGPWAGLGAPSQTTGRIVQLMGAQISATGRLSSSGNTSATLSPNAPDDKTARLEFSDRWASVNENRLLARCSLLSEPQPNQDWIILKPARFGKARFDAARQVLIWPLQDVDGQLLNVEVPYSAFSQNAIDRIEAISPDSMTDVLLVARIRNSATGAVAEPLSLAYLSPAGDSIRIDSLYFDAAPKTGLVNKALSTLRNIRAPGKKDEVPLELTAPVPAAMDQFQHWLARQSERGLGDAATGKITAELETHLQRLCEAGFSAFGSLRINGPLSTRLLALQYTYLQHLRLMGSVSGDSKNRE